MGGCVWLAIFGWLVLCEVGGGEEEGRKERADWEELSWTTFWKAVWAAAAGVLWALVTRTKQLAR